MVALGVCTSANPHEGGLGYMAGMFHLLTHAMFKALLFLGAGSIIHAVHSNEDVYKRQYYIFASLKERIVV